MKIAGVFHVLLALSLVVAGCATTKPDTMTPVTTQLAQVRSDVRSLEDKTKSISQSVEDIQTKIAVVERENLHVQNVIRQDQATITETLKKINAQLNARVSQNEIQAAIDNITKANAAEIERMNQTISKVVKTVEQANTDLQKNVAKDLTTLRNESKALQVQLNANLDKTDRLERSIRTLGSSAPAKATAPAGGNTQKTETATPIKRTGTPSRDDIDYVNVYKHQVVSGETLWKIARDYNVAIQDILNVNPDISDQKMLDIGQTIYVPSIKTDR